MPQLHTGMPFNSFLGGAGPSDQTLPLGWADVDFSWLLSDEPVANASPSSEMEEGILEHL